MLMYMCTYYDNFAIVKKKYCDIVIICFVVPLKKIDNRVSIYGFIANVKSDLHYVNEADESIETDFVFPLDSDAAVYKFEAEIDGRTIVAEVQEKSQVFRF